jgi:hypothetical protein
MDSAKIVTIIDLGSSSSIINLQNVVVLAC